MRLFILLLLDFCCFSRFPFSLSKTVLSWAPLYMPTSLTYLPPGIIKGNRHVLVCVTFLVGGRFVLSRLFTYHCGTACPRASQMPYQLVFDLVFRIRKVWQRRKCAVKNGILTISHATVSVSGNLCCAGCAFWANTRRHLRWDSLCLCAHSGQTVPGIPFQKKLGMSCGVLPLSVAPLQLSVFCPLKPNQVFFYNLAFGEVLLV